MHIERFFNLYSFQLLYLQNEDKSLYFTDLFWRINEMIYIKSTLIALADNFLCVRHHIKSFIFLQSVTLWVSFHCQLHFINGGTENLYYLLKSTKLVWEETESETRQPDSKPLPPTVTWYVLHPVNKTVPGTISILSSSVVTKSCIYLEKQCAQLKDNSSQPPLQRDVIMWLNSD